MSTVHLRQLYALQKYTATSLLYSEVTVKFTTLKEVQYYFFVTNRATFLILKEFLFFFFEIFSFLPHCKVRIYKAKLSISLKCISNDNNRKRVEIRNSIEMFNLSLGCE